MEIDRRGSGQGDTPVPALGTGVSKENRGRHNMLASVNRGLAHFIHPVAANPIFQGVATVFFGGFFTMYRRTSNPLFHRCAPPNAECRTFRLSVHRTYNSSANDVAILADLNQTRGKDGVDGMGGHRTFMKRDSIQQFMNLEPARHTPENIAALVAEGKASKEEEAMLSSMFKAGQQEPPKVEAKGFFKRCGTRATCLLPLRCRPLTASPSHSSFASRASQDLRVVI